MANPTPSYEIIASAPSLKLTNSLVAYGSYARYDGIIKTTMAISAIAGGPILITNRTSARVRAEQCQTTLLSTRHAPAAVIVATALMVSNKAKTRVMPSNSYMCD